MKAIPRKDSALFSTRTLKRKRRSVITTQRKQTKRTGSKAIITTTKKKLVHLFLLPSAQGKFVLLDCRKSDILRATTFTKMAKGTPKESKQGVSPQFFIPIRVITTVVVTTMQMETEVVTTTTVETTTETKESYSSIEMDGCIAARENDACTQRNHMVPISS